MKRYILSAADLCMNDSPSLDEINQVKSDYNWFYTQDSVKDFGQESIIFEIDRNFYNLCSIMEENGSVNPQNYSIIQFHSKINYLKSQTQNGQ